MSCSEAAAGLGNSPKKGLAEQLPASCTGNPHLLLPGSQGGGKGCPLTWACHCRTWRAPPQACAVMWRGSPEVRGGSLRWGRGGASLSQFPDPQHPQNSQHETPGLHQGHREVQGRGPVPSVGRRGCPPQSLGPCQVGLQGVGVQGSKATGLRTRNPAAGGGPIYGPPVLLCRFLSCFFPFNLSLRSQQRPFGKFQAGSAVLRTGEFSEAGV